MEDYKKITLKEIADFRTGKLNSNAAKEDGEYPFFTCSPETLRIDRYSFNTRAILLAGNNANAIYPIKKYEGKFDAYQRTYVITIKDDTKIDFDYLYYSLVLRLNYFKDISQGSATKFLTAAILNDLCIETPPLEEQKSIAAVLSCLDRKIENLRKQNETLEAIAQTLFKRWFIDFEFPYDFAQGKPSPDGQPYKSSGGAMQPSELGDIPEGWRVSPASSLIKLQGGFAFKSSDFNEHGQHRIIKIKNISNNIVNIQKTSFISDDVSQSIDAKFKVKSMDILIAMTGAEVAKIGAVPINTSSLWLNQRVGLFQEKKDGGKIFIYYLFSSPEYQKLLKDKGSGSSAQPNISASDIESILIICPMNKVLSDFHNLAFPLFYKKCFNQGKIQTLTKTRDTLLPKLMNGQLRITP
jgi:type I restriction enzyme S subunit